MQKNDKELVNLIFNIIIKIKDLPAETKTSIANLIDYKPEVSLVSPLK